MKSIYAMKLSDVALAIADVQPCNDPHTGFMITRINVPEAFRRQGIGSQLLQAVCDEASVENATLYLIPASSGGLSQEQLIQWYTKFGFRRIIHPWSERIPYMRRIPRIRLAQEFNRKPGRRHMGYEVG